MVHRPQYIENLALASTAASSVPGSVVECGTWRGGMAAGLIETMGVDRQYYFFDSFEGLPKPTAEDGPAAFAWQADVTSKDYLDNCAASLDDFTKVISRTKLPASHRHVVKGFYENTLPSFDEKAVGQVAVLRLDSDWYESTIICLKKFWHLVADGGIVLVDDYSQWDGCTRAVNEYIAATDPRQRISQGPLGRVTYIVKRAAPPPIS